MLIAALKEDSSEEEKFVYAGQRAGGKSASIHQQEGLVMTDLNTCRTV